MDSSELVTVVEMVRDAMLQAFKAGAEQTREAIIGTINTPDADDGAAVPITGDDDGWNDESEFGDDPLDEEFPDPPEPHSPDTMPLFYGRGNGDMISKYAPEVSGD